MLPLRPKNICENCGNWLGFSWPSPIKPVNRHKHFDGHLDSKIEPHVVSVLLRSCEQAHTRIGCTCPKSIGWTHLASFWTAAAVAAERWHLPFSCSHVGWHLNSHFLQQSKAQTRHKSCKALLTHRLGTGSSSPKIRIQMTVIDFRSLRRTSAKRRSNSRAAQDEALLKERRGQVQHFSTTRFYCRQMDNVM